MKNILIALCILISYSGHSQFFESNQELSVGDQNAFITDHKDADDKMVEKIIEKTLEQYGKVKRNRKAKEWTCIDCMISTISMNPLNVYYKVKEGMGLVTSSLFFDDGTKFISSSNDSIAALGIEKLNKSIYYEVRRAVITNELEVAEDELKKFDKELVKLVKNNTNLHNDIEDYKEKIRKAEMEIESNLQEQQDKNLEITKQGDKIKQITDKLNNVGRE